jgi:glycosyltransferase involved in cell wall biosynthesis
MTISWIGWTVLGSALVYVLLQTWLVLGWFRDDERGDVGQDDQKREQNAEPKKRSNSHPPLSIIVAVHNEEQVLPGLISSLANQLYENFEVIFALDRCTDASEALIDAQIANESRLGQAVRFRKVVINETGEGWTPKKWALEQAIQAAKRDWLVFTDADCQAEQDWLLELSKKMNGETSVILGVSPYLETPGFLNSFIRYETFLTLFQYVGMARWGKPYMAVGRNLAYRRSFYEKTGGQGAIRERLSGDDDLLINRHGGGVGVKVVTEPGSRVLSHPARTFRAWWRQKTRHVSASTAYTGVTKSFLAIFHGAHTIFYLSLLVYFCVEGQWGQSALLYGSRMLISAGLFRLVYHKRKFQPAGWLFPLLDLAFFLYNLILVPAGWLSQPKWR